MYSNLSFKLSNSSIEKLNNEVGPYEISDIATFVFARTYCRNKFKFNHEGKQVYDGKETFEDVVTRIVNGTFSLLKDSLQPRGLWDQEKYYKQAEKFYKLVHSFKNTPPGRGFWAMGTSLVHEKKLAMSLVNCSFISSENIDKVKGEFFTFVNDALMLGVGVGFDTNGAGKLRICSPQLSGYQHYNSTHNGLIFLESIRDECTMVDGEGIKYIDHEIKYINDVFLLNKHYVSIHTVGDSREGWGIAVKTLINSYLEDADEYLTIFDYSEIRPRGTKLKTFDGTASGPRPLAEGIATIRRLLELNKNKELSAVLITDITNIIASYVVAGNVRRSSEILISDDLESIEYKNYFDPRFKYRANWGWCSNNSVRITEEMFKSPEYPDLIKKICKNVSVNGEPGIFNMYLPRNYGRIADGIDQSDNNVKGSNPCGEIPLEGESPVASSKPYSGGGETCNICETFPSNYEGTFEEVLSEYKENLYFSVLYCKLVTTIPPHWKGTKEIQDRNRRIGVSITGLIDFIVKHEIDIWEDEKTNKLVRFLDESYKAVCKYDEEISELLDIPISIRKTTIKPSGTTSKCGGVSAGMHAEIGKYYLKNVRVSKTNTTILDEVDRCNFYREDCVMQPFNTSVVTIPVYSKYSELTRQSVSVEFQFRLLHLLQTYWADNQVSCTISFKNSEQDKLADLLLKYKDSIKAVSFLPLNNQVYEQMPEVIIDEDKYNSMREKTIPLKLENLLPKSEIAEIEYDKYCNGDKCVLPPKNKA